MPQTLSLSESNKLVIVYAARFGQAMRSHGSTSNFLTHVRGQIKKAKVLIIPAAFRMFKSFGQMDLLVSLKGNINVKVDAAKRTTLPQPELEENNEETKEPVTEKIRIVR